MPKNLNLTQINNIQYNHINLEIIVNENGDGNYLSNLMRVRKNGSRPTNRIAAYFWDFNRLRRSQPMMHGLSRRTCHAVQF